MRYCITKFGGGAAQLGEEIGANQQAELFLEMVLNSLTMLILGGYALFLVDDGFPSVILIRDFIYIYLNHIYLCLRH